MKKYIIIAIAALAFQAYGQGQGGPPAELPPQAAPQAQKLTVVLDTPVTIGKTISEVEVQNVQSPRPNDPEGAYVATANIHERVNVSTNGVTITGRTFYNIEVRITKQERADAIGVDVENYGNTAIKPDFLEQTVMGIAKAKAEAVLQALAGQ